MILPFRLEARTTPSRAMRFAVPLIAALLTLVFGFVIFGLVGRDPAQAMVAFFIEPLSTINGWSELLLKASPLCLIGLGLAAGYRANVWNIGAEGQMVLGGIAASGVAIACDQLSGWWILPTMMAAGIAGGVAWAAIPAWLKTRFNTSEILTSLMLTYVATQLLVYLVSGPWRDPMGMNFPLSEMFGGDALYPTFGGDWRWHLLRGTRLNASIFVTMIAVPLVWLFMRRSFAGYRMSVGGLAPLAARYAGFSDKKTVWTSLLLSGGLAGLAGMGEIAGPIGQLQATWSPGYGFTAIIVVFVGRLSPVGIVLASLLMALLYLGGEAVQTSLQLPQALSGVFQGLLLFCLLGADLFVNYRVRRRHAVTPAH
ncbi:MAG TPA: ABC transporter permease [Paraburkholderia sp.]|nr:ABC transporter permease [Paraburkholderia sp.]